jgi:hypothetical protein
VKGGAIDDSPPIGIHASRGTTIRAHGLSVGIYMSLALSVDALFNDDRGVRR